jgi:hypothetical protein
MSKRQTQRIVTELTVPKTGKPRKAEVVVTVSHGVTLVEWTSGFHPDDAGFSVLQDLLERDARTIEISYRLRACCVRLCMTRQERIQVPAADVAWLVSELRAIFAASTAQFERMRGKASFAAPVADARPAPLLESTLSPDRPAPKAAKAGLRISMEAGSD